MEKQHKPINPFLITLFFFYFQASITLELQPLLNLLVDPNERQGYAWIRMRITRMWHRWVDAASSLVAKYHLNNRPKQKVCLLLSFCAVHLSHLQVKS